MTQPGDPPTACQRQVLAFIAKYLATRGYAPSMDDIRRRFAFSSITAARDHLVALERKGLITRQRKVARSIRLTQTGTSICRTSPAGAGQCPTPDVGSPEKENEP